MINCSIFPSILKSLRKRNQIRKPKFWIGDYVELQFENEEGSKHWERGIVRGIMAPGFEWNSAKDKWLYYYETTETSYSPNFRGASCESFEDELTLIP